MILLVLPLMAISNWLFEINKWRLLVSTKQKLSFRNAAVQCLSALSGALATPNKIGEYGIKALYFKPELRKRILFFKLVSNTSQMFTTILFGLPCLLILIINYNITIALWKSLTLVGSVLILLISGYYFREKQLMVKGLSIKNLIKNAKNLPNRIWVKVIAQSVLRYLVFSTMFFLLLKVFGSTLSFSDSFVIIAAMYLIASAIPTFVFTDVAVKGGVAIWLFSFAEVSELIVLYAIFCSWILNTVIPAILGSIFVAKYKPVLK